VRGIANLSVCLVVLAASVRPANGREAGQGPTWGFFAISEVGDPLKDLPLVSWSRRTGLMWSKLELPPGSGRYDWNYMDGLVGKAQENDVNLVFVLKTGSPPEASEAACYQEAARGGGAGGGSRPPRGREHPGPGPHRRRGGAGAGGAEGGDPESRGERETNTTSCPIRDDYLPAWKRLVAAVIERYDGDGKDDMPRLARGFRLDIEVENEAGYRVFWDPAEPDGTRAAKAFLPLLRAAYEAKESANPATRIIAPGITQPQTLARCATNLRGKECSDPLYVRNRDFAEEVLKHPQYFDAVDVHFFNYFRFDPDFIPDGIRWVRDQMRRAGGEKPIYSLEWTGAMMMNVKRDGHEQEFLSQFPFPEAARLEALQQIYKNLSDPRNEKYRRWFELEQAREFPKLFTTLLAQGVQRLIHVQFHDYLGQGWNSVWWNWQGIVSYEGNRSNPVLIRKPVYYTYQTLAPKLAGFERVEVLASGDRVGYKFLFPDRKPVVVAWTNTGERTVDLSRHLEGDVLRVTPLVEEAEDQGRPIRPEPRTAKSTVVRLTETPVLIEAAEGSNRR